MRHILHILTETDRGLASSVIDSQKAETGIQVEAVDMASGDVDYDQLLDQIFAADSVQVW